MTSISSMSPADRIQQMLQSAVSAGTVNSADQSALSSAISDIDTALQSGTASSTSVKPGDMKSKVDGLVDQEVTDGKLTSDQADELKQVFAQASQAMGHHHGGHHVKASSDSSAISDITSTDTSSTDSSSTASSSTSSTSTDSLTSSIENLIGFLKKLETATSSTTNYTASGASAGSSAQNLLANLFA